MTRDEQVRLLGIGRAAVRNYLAGCVTDPPHVDLSWPDQTLRGVFITLRRGNRLRGCIGTFMPNRPLPETVWAMAIAAAEDPRFVNQPILLEELSALSIDISVLSPLQRTREPLSLTPGEHGIYIRSAHRSGCFLPEVATECGWSAQEFLERCCTDKADLPADAWKDPGTEVHLFTVEKLSESALAAHAAIQ